MTKEPLAPRGRSVLRVSVMAIVGCATGTTVGVLSQWWFGVVTGWAAAAATYLVWVWLTVRRLDAVQTRSHATREDPGLQVSDMLILLASLASLGAVTLLLLISHTPKAIDKAVVAAVALGSVAVSWLLVHTLYALRYAREYYSDPVGGIDFNNPAEPPRYIDFAYLAFDLGMTYQVSDTSLTSSELRSIVFRHTLLSYVFGAVVLATTINLVAGLLG